MRLTSETLFGRGWKRFEIFIYLCHFFTCQLNKRCEIMLLIDTEKDQGEHQFGAIKMKPGMSKSAHSKFRQGWVTFKVKHRNYDSTKSHWVTEYRTYVKWMNRMLHEFPLSKAIFWKPSQESTIHQHHKQMELQERTEYLLHSYLFFFLFYFENSCQLPFLTQLSVSSFRFSNLYSNSLVVHLYWI